MNSKKILEINPSHPAVKELFERVKDDPDKETEDLAKVLFEGALINSGYSLREPNAFSKRFYRLFNGALGIPRDAPLEEIEIDLDEESEDDAKKPDDKGADEEEDDLDDEVDDEPTKAEKDDL
mmetsp:Transcript_98691/g.137000  ORF Transcript_98691/g.137000 Transcript_98691/m.137000 type:complete len:123 (+) Transcript_98691:262-630(+)